MKRSKFLTTWLIVMLILSVAIALDSLTYLRTILLTKNYLQLLGIVAGLVQIWALILIFQWKKIGITLVLCTTIIGFIVTVIDQPTVFTNVHQEIINICVALTVDIILLGILYLAIKPMWKRFK